MLTEERDLDVSLTLLHLQENLSEILQENVKFTFRQQLARFSAHIAAWLVSTGVAIACCAAVYYLAEYNSEVIRQPRIPGCLMENQVKGWHDGGKWGSVAGSGKSLTQGFRVCT